MASGIHSTIRSLKNQLQLRWVPKWYGAFSDPNGGFYERLGRDFKPLLTGQRRLVTQCRQLSIYSHAENARQKPLFAKLEQQFEFILTHYRDDATGLWHFSLEDSAAVKDRTCDLYALSFVIFSFSHYFRARKDPRATYAARQVIDLIDTKFRLEELPGFAEAIDTRYRPLPQMRRQNPHMHLLEACLFAYEVWGDDIYKKIADEMVDLFRKYFFDAKENALSEFYSDALHPHFEQGGKYEPGHYFEWVWLLKKHAAINGVEGLHDALCTKLLDWANFYGWDQKYGGIYDTLGPKGKVLSDTKRIWPFCEALKANALMLDSATDRQKIKDRTQAMVNVFESKYMQERGFWTESLTRDLAPATDYMPGTTPYHVYFGIMETWDVISARGGSVSLFAALLEKLYTFRRFASNLVKSTKAS